MKIQILQVGKTKDPNLKALEEEFEKRLSGFVKLETITVDQSRKDVSSAKKQECDSLLSELDEDAFKIALDENGKCLSSLEFSMQLMSQRDFGTGKVQFIIGGSHGLDPRILREVNFVLSLSKMTFTHEMVRVFLKEQIYRAFTILGGRTYHK